MGIPEKLEKLQSVIESLSPKDKKLSKFFTSLRNDIAEHERQLRILSVAGAELSKEQEQSSALELILYTARHLTNADAGTVYSVREEFYDNPFNPGELKSKSLVFEVMHTESKKFFVTKPEGIPPVPMEIDGKPNNSHVSAYCANTGNIVNIPDVYDAKGFDFSGPKNYDKQTNYRSKSMLVLPLRDHENQINGVLQLLNRQTIDREVIPFSQNDQTIVQAMSYQAAISLTTQKLLKEQIDLFDAFVRVLAEGLGEKSPYTFGHINRVADLSCLLADTISKYNSGLYDYITFSKSQMDELHLAGWMHDIGKLTSPEHVVSKPIKLQTVVDRFELIVQRFNSKIKDIEIEYLKKESKGLKEKKKKAYFDKLKEEKDNKINKLLQDLAELNKTNNGGEFLEKRIRDLIIEKHEDTADQHIRVKTKKINGDVRIIGVERAKRKIKESLVNKEEKDFLSISKGTLNDSERQIINDHADRSWRWLMKLPFPKKKKKLPLYAGAHHETLAGEGYPNKLKAEQLPIQSRIIAVADIFEALTAHDRPYKSPMKLSNAMNIMGRMVESYLLDAEIVKIFLKSGLYKKYARKYLTKNQIDNIDIEHWLETYYPKNFEPNLPKHES
ncbi:MAG: GAF domain-containing protein [Proteobacteria bacterium]|nr:GAF domain-containing protein [Pseudomonadota bacterium]